MGTILVVDDEPMVLTLCQRILKLGSYNVLAASGGEEALRLMRANPGAVDLALLDVMMPGMNGIELAEKIRGIEPSTRIVLMSGFGPREISRVVGTNPYRIIWKPFKTESLLRMLENALEDSAGTVA